MCNSCRYCDAGDGDFVFTRGETETNIRHVTDDVAEWPADGASSPSVVHIPRTLFVARRHFSYVKLGILLNSGQFIISSVIVCVPDRITRSDRTLGVINTPRGVFTDATRDWPIGPKFSLISTTSITNPNLANTIM